MLAEIKVSGDLLNILRGFYSVTPSTFSLKIRYRLFYQAVLVILIPGKNKTLNPPPTMPMGRSFRSPRFLAARPLLLDVSILLLVSIL